MRVVKAMATTLLKLRLENVWFVYGKQGPQYNADIF